MSLNTCNWKCVFALAAILTACGEGNESAKRDIRTHSGADASPSNNSSVLTIDPLSSRIFGACVSETILTGQCSPADTSVKISIVSNNQVYSLTPGVCNSQGWTKALKQLDLYAVGILPTNSFKIQIEQGSSLVVSNSTRAHEISLFDSSNLELLSDKPAINYDIHVCTDIDMTGKFYRPIRQHLKNLFGHDHTIKNLHSTIDGASSVVGGLINLSNGKVTQLRLSNLALDIANQANSLFVGGLVGHSAQGFDTIAVDRLTILMPPLAPLNSIIGGLAGTLCSASKSMNISISEASISGNGTLGGIFGQTTDGMACQEGGPTSLLNLKFSGALMAQTSATAGGIIGKATHLNANLLEVSAVIKAAGAGKNAAGIVSAQGESIYCEPSSCAPESLIENARIVGTIESQSGYASGLISGWSTPILVRNSVSGAQLMTANASLKFGLGGSAAQSAYWNKSINPDIVTNLPGQTGVGATTTALTSFPYTPGVYTNWNFSEIWQPRMNDYPGLR